MTQPARLSTPARLSIEQREGRVDRYGQPSPKVRVVTYYGEDTGVDRIILRVLLRKHKTIRSSLGISVPVPARAEELVEAIFEDVLLHKRPKDNRQMLLEFGSADNQSKAPDECIELRIGIKLGDIIVDGTDIAGDGVNVAARLEARTEPGGICVSAAVREQVHGSLDEGFSEIGEQEVKDNHATV